MIEIEVNSNGKETTTKCNVKIGGRTNAIKEFYAVLCALSECDEDVLLDALGCMVSDKLEGGDDDDESES